MINTICSWSICFLITYSSLTIEIDGQIISKLIDNLACRRTSNNGFYGECVPRRCCRSVSAVRNLCLTSSDHVCCYGEDICRFPFDEQNRYLPTHDPNRRYPLDTEDYYPEREYVDRCNRFSISRHEWQASPALNRPLELLSNINHVIIHHSGEIDDHCWSMEQCRRQLHRMQSYYQREQNFPDIPWNFLINDNGDIFEGVGWHHQGYHTEDWNDRSIGIAFLGDFNRARPSRRSLRSLLRLLQCGARNGFLNRYYQIEGHRDVKHNDCPGRYLYAAIKRLTRDRLDTISDPYNQYEDDFIGDAALDFLEDYQERSNHNTSDSIKNSSIEINKN
ncbi:hypothetical protein NH340_JMT07806 [Sarcoptes scabiei]|nr:hypothetical protein NH340_JMT07806 [Sarcoptes scabiei]